MKGKKHDPPKPAKKEGWFKRFLKFILPRRAHKYLTPEVFVAWNVSSYVTLGNVLLVKYWKLVLGWFHVKVVPLFAKFWTDVKDVVTTAWDMVYAITHVSS